MGKKYIKLLFYSSIIAVIIFVIYINNYIAKEEPFVPGKDLFLNSFYSFRSTELNNDIEFDTTKITSIKSKEKFDKELRVKILELIDLPLKKVPVDKLLAQQLETKDKGKYEESHIYILTSENSVAPAYLLIPKDVEFPAPAVIAMHQHGDNYDFGKDEVAGNIGDENMAYGKELAEHGYIVLVTDVNLFGERGGVFTGNLSQENSPEIREIIETQNLLLLGHTPFGFIVQEDIISLNFLESLDIVDKSNIGCIGHSMGGIRCMYLAALDERIKATVISGAVGNIRRIPSSGVTQTWLTLLPGIGEYAKTSSILGLIAPRPLFISLTKSDPIFPLPEAQSNINELINLYKLLEQSGEQPENIEGVVMEGGHNFFPEARKKSYLFLDKHLKN